MRAFAYDQKTVSFQSADDGLRMFVLVVEKQFSMSKQASNALWNSKLRNILAIVNSFKKSLIDFYESSIEEIHHFSAFVHF